MKERGIAPLIIVAVIVVVGVIAGVGIYVAMRGSGEPDFEVSANPTSISIHQGGSENVAITIRSINGFSSEVFWIANLFGNYASSVSTSLNGPDAPPPNGEINQTLTIGIPIDMPTGSISITYTYDENVWALIHGGLSGSHNHRAEITVTIIPGESSYNSPISITGNGDFTPANGVTSGSGTADDPYIIENKNIYISSFTALYPEGGIVITDTSAYFVIRNCYVHGWGWSGSSQPLGISLDSVINGIVENNIVDNFITAISLGYSDNNRISNNTFEGNSHGIELGHSDNNIIWNNTVKNNSYLGIGLDTSENNSIYHNDFIGNGTGGFFSQAFAYTPNSISPNYWDNGYPSGGNYWSNYTGVDENSGINQNIPGGDGIGDTPYSIDPDYASANQDRYPLMNPI